MAARASPGRSPLAQRTRPLSAKRVLTNRADALLALAEAFREYGFDGASLSTLSRTTGLGKGSLYNFFPGGKVEMIEAVLADIDGWFVESIFAPLEQTHDPISSITVMMDDVTAYFRSGRRVCLLGTVGLGASGDAFASRTQGYFARWIAALSRCLQTGHVPSPLAEQLAEEVVSGIQGAIVLARASNDAATFTRIIGRRKAALLDALPSHKCIL